VTAYADAIAKPPRTLTDLEQKLIMKTTGEHRDGYRDHCIISLALGTGLREHGSGWMMNGGTNSGVDLGTDGGVNMGTDGGGTRGKDRSYQQ
jgi:hypothetical protein